MMENLTGIYCICMEDVKSRLSVVKTVAGGQLSTGSELFDYEFVSVQIRKSLELVAFASMTANKNLYAEAHAGFANHWKAKDMLNNLKRLHPGFYPQPIRLDHVKESGDKHFEHVEDGYLTQDDFVTLYDLCSEVLHTWNPFTKKERHIDFKRSVAEWVQRIDRLLRLHLMRFVDREEIWVVDMEYSEDGKVHAFTAGALQQAI
ncbi:MAG: hypothetical protein HY578_06215 [Nitrospinae bacterium]|nr:hypothetical protein [Nitrospinota bacterium]